MARLNKGAQLRPRHLVDGIPILMYQRLDGNRKLAWYGRWKVGKRQCTRYFGVEDPRGKYAVCTEACREFEMK